MPFTVGPTPHTVASCSRSGFDAGCSARSRPRTRRSSALVDAFIGARSTAMCEPRPQCRDLARRACRQRCKRSSSVLVAREQPRRRCMTSWAQVRTDGSRSSGARPAARRAPPRGTRRARAASRSRARRCSCAGPARAPRRGGRRREHRRSPRAACGRSPRARGDDTTSSSWRLAWRHRLTVHHMITAPPTRPIIGSRNHRPAHQPSEQRRDREHRRERVGEDVDVRGAQVEVERAGLRRLLPASCS